MKMKQMQWWTNSTDNACHHILNTNRVTEVYKNAGLTRYRIMMKICGMN